MTSAFAPAALKSFFEALGIQLEATTSMQLAGFNKFIAGDGVILSSISGNTRRTVEAAHVAKASGARVVALTCGENSALAKARGRYRHPAIHANLPPHATYP